jgi:hypothetical protein
MVLGPVAQQPAGDEHGHREHRHPDACQPAGQQGGDGHDTEPPDLGDRSRDRRPAQHVLSRRHAPVEDRADRAEEDVQYGIALTLQLDRVAQLQQPAVEVGELGTTDREGVGSVQ